MTNETRPDLRPIAHGTLVVAVALACSLPAACMPRPQDGATGEATAAAFPAGRGAAVPWIEFQAEDAATSGTILGPNRTKWDASHIEAEAIGRKAVRLDRTGQFVAFHTTAPANSIVVRFSIPDAPGGGGIDATLGLYINGTRVRSLPLTSRFNRVVLKLPIAGWGARTRPLSLLGSTSGTTFTTLVASSGATFDPA